MYEKERYLIKRAINEAGLPNGNYFIAGGACTSVFSNKPINDLDIYFRTEEGFNAFTEGHMQKLDAEDHYIYSLVAVTNNALTYKKGKSTIQLIKKYFLNPKDLIEKFDFTICQCAYNNITDEFILGEDFLHALASRSLKFTGKTDYPIASFYRMKKFMSRGYNASAVDMIAMALCVNNLVIKTFVDLKAQLEGIDTFLLKDLTDALITKGEAEYNMTEALAMMNAKLEEKYNSETIEHNEIIEQGE